MTNISPQELKGNWEKGFALDLHTLSSEKDPVLERYNTNRTEIGELMYRVKYDGWGENLAPKVGKIASDFICGKYKSLTNDEYPYPPLDGIISIPPSEERAYQPVLAIAQKISDTLGIPVLDNLKKSKKPLV